MKLAFFKHLKFKKSKQTIRQNSDGENSEFTLTNATYASPFNSKLQIWFGKTSLWFQMQVQPILRKADWSLIRKSAFLLTISFVAASGVNTYSASLAFKLFSFGAKGKDIEIVAPAISFGGGAGQSSTLLSLKDIVLKRNLFNSDGTLAPDLDVANEANKKTADLNFESVECSSEKLPVEVLGVIYTGNPKKSFVILKDAKITDADIYDPGKVIIDHEEIEIYKVNQGAVEFRKGDTKLCVDITGREEKLPADMSPKARPEAVETVEIDDAEMKTLLGPELSRAMNEAKLIPDVQVGTGQVMGFRLLGIQAGSVFDRLKFMNEDLVAEVNGTSLKDLSQGFRLLEALQQQREISINFTRKGEPMVRKVRVK